MPSIKYIDLAELQVALARIPHATPATIVAVTNARMNKTAKVDGQKIENPYFGNIKKRVISNVFIGVIYENSVNKALEKEGKEATFKVSPRKWGRRIEGTCLVEHKGKWYLETRFLHSTSPEYFHNGQPIDKEKIEKFFPKSRSNATHQGLEKEIVLRDYSLESIKEIKVMGNHYIIK